MSWNGVDITERLLFDMDQLLKQNTDTEWSAYELELSKHFSNVCIEDLFAIKAAHRQTKDRLYTSVSD